MPRDLVYGNGRLLVNLDASLFIRDVYWPYVGQLNHVSGYRCRVGAWTADAGFAWLDAPEWRRSVGYAAGSPVGDSVAESERLGLAIRFRQAVDPASDLFGQVVTVTSRWDAPRAARLFLAYDLRIDESDIGDTAFYHPYTGSMIHYKRDRFFLMSGQARGAGENGASRVGVSHYACGEKAFQGAEGAWRDAEDGWLSGNAIAQGSVDSVTAYDLALPPLGAAVLEQWMVVGPDLPFVIRRHDAAAREGMDAVLARANADAAAWLAPVGDALAGLPDAAASLARRSLLVMRTQIDRGGAVIASTDSDILETARAHYAYVWPRDGALVARPLDRLGLRGPTGAFFAFCRRLLDASPLSADAPGGEGRVAALLHKYGPDGTLGASWHAWTVPPHGREVPIQEDGTALVVWAAARHLLGDGNDGEPVNAGAEAEADALYEGLILPGARFVAAHRDPRSGLPLPSWDVWEERRGIHCFTVAAAAGAMDQVARLAERRGDAARARSFAAVAGELRSALEERFWNPERRCLARMLTRDEATGALTQDATIDASIAAVFAFGALPAAHPRVAASMRAVADALTVRTAIGGVARYENDYYFRQPEAWDRAVVPGNAWIICTLWLADWQIATAADRDDLAAPLALLRWAAERASPSGILPEQVHPFTGAPLSVAPLTWSHAQYVATALDWAARWRKLG